MAPAGLRDAECPGGVNAALGDIRGVADSHGR